MSTTKTRTAPAKAMQAPDKFLHEGLKAERRKMYAARAQSTAAARSATQSHYQGEELRPYQGRPGSLDFLRLPSVMGSRRVYRKDAA